MTFTDLLLQQTINGLSLGAMYSLLALGFTLVYGILELINFSHFNVFMIGSFVALWTLQMFGLSGQDVILTGLPLAGVLLVAFIVTMLFCGGLGVVIERVTLRPLRNVKGPAAMITSIGVSYILFNIVLLTVGADSKNFPNPLPTIRCHIGERNARFPRRTDLDHRPPADAGPVLLRATLPSGQGDACHRAGPGSGADDGRGS